VPDYEDDPLTEAERIFLRALSKVRFLLVGLSAAVLQGADCATKDLDLWLESLDTPEIGKAAILAGGFYAARMQPPMVGGKGLERIDLVTHCDGLDLFDVEYRRAIAVPIGDLELRVLPLERIIASKTAANRPKDRAVLEQLRAALAVQREIEGRTSR
jgi:hypothetical protein